MSYTIEFYNEAVKGEILEWPAGIRASFIRIAERMTDTGPNLGMPYTRAMGAGFSRSARGARKARAGLCSAPLSAAGWWSFMGSSRKPSRRRQRISTPLAAG